MKSLIILLILNLVIILFVVEAKTDTPVTYLSYVDNLLGFYKVTDLTTHEPSPYENRTLIINEGDTVTWINDADNNVILTVVSEDKLFTDKRLNTRQRSSYTFNQIGTYSFYIREYSSRQQTIIVNSLVESSTTVPQETPQQTTEQIIPISTPPTTVNIMTTPTVSGPNLPSSTQIASIIVGLVSIFMTYLIGRK